MNVSLIITVLNEGRSIRALLDSIAAQQVLPGEIVICDGGSSDDTCAIIDEYAARLPIRLISRPGANISQGRNAAIAAAAHDVLAVTDAGVRLHPAWLAHITGPLLSDPAVNVTAGFFLPDAHTPFEMAMGATVLPSLEHIEPASFMPSSRSVAFRRVAWAQAGGYPEWLDFCEDLILDFNLHSLCGPFAFAPQAVVYFRPRSSLPAFLRQYYLYARGDGKANLFMRRHLIRYLTYLLALPGLLAAALLHHPAWLVLLALGGLWMLWRPYRRLVAGWAGLNAVQRLEAWLWVPTIRIAGDLAKMAGYPAGHLWRLRHHPPDWRKKAHDQR